MTQVYNFIYNMNIPLLCILGLLILGGWTAIAVAVSRKSLAVWRWVSVVAMGIAVFLIVGKTLLGRAPYPELHFPQWNPLHSVILYWDQPQQWRAMFMNILLFAPLGAVLPYLLPGSPRRRVWTALSLCAGLSMVIEIIQQATYIGALQTEDWLLNCCGGLCGALAYLAFCRFCPPCQAGK